MSLAHGWHGLLIVLVQIYKRRDASRTFFMMRRTQKEVATHTRRFGRKLKLPSTVAIKHEILKMMVQDELKAQALAVKAVEVLVAHGRGAAEALIAHIRHDGNNIGLHCCPVKN